MIDFESRDGRAEFIESHENGLYSGTNIDGEEVMVLTTKGAGMDVYTKHAAKPLWWEVIGYNAEGYQESVTYSATAELEDKLAKYDTRKSL
jgi:hypothetical protein